MARTGETFRGEDGSGKSLTIELRDRIQTQSGEGEIWRTSLPNQICKIYLSEHGLARRSEKLQVMLAHPPKRPGRPRRHLDRLADGAVTRTAGAPSSGSRSRDRRRQASQRLYDQALRKRTAVGIDWFYIHTAALNVAKVCSAVHERGYVIGDLKADNWLVDRSMQTVVIDTDSFQICDPRTSRIYHCPVGSPDYTAREIMNKDFSSFERLSEHDHFAMAVLIFQFLTDSTRSQAGPTGAAAKHQVRDQTLIRIERGWWLYGGQGRYRPLPTDVPFDVLHPALQTLFRRSFDDGHKAPSVRPSAKEWEVALDTAISSLAWCTAEEMHVYSGHQGKCSWCALRKATGHDRWPTYKKGSSRSFEVARQRLRAAFRDSDFLQVLNAADNNPKLKLAKDLQTIIAEAEKWRPVKKAMEALQGELAKPEPDPALIAGMVAREPRLEELANGVAGLAAKLAQALALDASVKELSQAVDSAPGRQGVFAIGPERLIADRFLKHEQTLRGRRDLEQRFGPRVKEARQRVGRFDKISAALAAGDELTVQQEMNEWRAVLDTIGEFQPLAAEAEKIGRRVTALRQFIAQAVSASADDEELCRLWESEPGVGDCRLAQAPAAQLGGISPAQRYARARERRDAIAALTSLVRGLDARAGADVIAAHETSVLTAYRDAETRVGTSRRPQSRS